MNFLIESHLKSKTEEISFLQLKPDAHISITNYEIPEEGLYVPFLTSELAENIKTKKENEVLTVGGMMRGIIFTLGIDSEFKYKEEYIKFLNAVEPRLEEYIVFHGSKYVDEEKLLEGLVYFKTLVMLIPDNEDAIVNYCIILLRYAEEVIKNKPQLYKLFKEEAKQKLEHLFELGYDVPLVNYHLGFIAREEKQYIKAQLHWTKVLEFSQEEDLKEHVSLLLRGIEDLVIYETGYEAILAGDPKKGLPFLQQLEDQYEEWWNLIFFIGLAHRQLGDYEKAMDYFSRVLELKDDQVDAIVELGVCLSSVGDYEDAIEHFKQAILIGGDNSEVLSNLAITYMEIGDYTTAKECITRSLELDPEDEITKLCKKRLDELMN